MMVASSPTAPTEAPPADPQLTGLGELPFVWYTGAVADLELFGDGVPLETDEVASAPDVSNISFYFLATHSRCSCRGRSTF